MEVEGVGIELRFPSGLIVVRVCMCVTVWVASWVDCMCMEREPYLHGQRRKARERRGGERKEE